MSFFAGVLVLMLLTVQLYVWCAGGARLGGVA